MREDTPLLDVRDCETAKEAAKHTAEWLEEHHLGDMNADLELGINPPEESRWDCWEVLWESGPPEWAVNLTLYGTMYEGHKRREQVDALYKDTGIFIEPGYRFSLTFTDE